MHPPTKDQYILGPLVAHTVAVAKIPLVALLLHNYLVVPARVRAHTLHVDVSARGRAGVCARVSVPAAPLYKEGAFNKRSLLHIHAPHLSVRYPSYRRCPDFAALKHGMKGVIVEQELVQA
jgi:hypothetical protein